MKTWIVRRQLLSLLLILLPLSLGSCTGNPKDSVTGNESDEPAYTTVYLIDSFTRENTTADEKLVKIVDIAIDKKSRRCLLERPAESPGKAQEVVFGGIKPIDGEKLEFGIGIREEAYTAVVNGKHLGGVIFGVWIVDGGKREPVFEHTLRPFEKKEDQGWHDFSVDLSPYAGRTVDIVFTTRFADGSWVWGHSMWSEPVLIAPRLEPPDGRKEVSLKSILSYKNTNLLDSFTRENTTGDEEHVNITNVTVACESRRCLYEHPIGTTGKDQEVIFNNIELSKTARLEFGIGIREQAYTAVVDGKHLGGVVFLVFIDDGKTKEPVFECTLRPFERKEDRGWHDFSVDLSRYAGKTVNIIFVTRFAPGSWVWAHAFWSGPRVVNSLLGDDCPNIILISVDTLRADHLGCYGYNRDTSPNIDKFARDSVLYKYSFSHAPHTLESHSSIMTSLNTNKHMAFKEGLSDSYITMAELLSHLGYHTVSYNGGLFLSKEYGLNQGFDEYYSFKNAGIVDDVWWELGGAIDFLKKRNTTRSHGEKFFLFLHTYQVHSAYNPPKEYQKLFIDDKDMASDDIPSTVKIGDIYNYQKEYMLEHEDVNFPEDQKEYFRNMYDAEIRYTDTWLGRFFDFLKEEGLYDDSLIILLADHGEQFYEHQGWIHCTVYGHDLYVPLIVKYPHSTNKGVEKERIARSVDVLPTILYDFLNIKVTDGNFDGIPLSRPIDDQPTISSRMNYGAGPEKRNISEMSVIKDKYKFIYSFRDDTYEVYEYKKDMINMKKVDVNESIIRDFSDIVSSENKITRENLKKKRNAGEPEKKLDEETVKSLRDLGYLQ